MCVVVLFGAPLSAQPPRAPRPTSSADTTLDRRTRELASQLRCPVCQGLSINDSPAELAVEMKGVVREQLAAGKSPGEVREYFIEKYGEWVLLEPDPRGFNVLVYAIPVLALLGGGAFVWAYVRRLTRRDDVVEHHP
jgi:cytochrome c-type biogenesis protein CcmH